MRAEFAARSYRHSPYLIILYSYFTNVTLFEAVIRVCIYILEYLYFPFILVLTKTDSISNKESRRDFVNFVYDLDRCIANNYRKGDIHSFFVSFDTSSYTYPTIKNISVLIQGIIGFSGKVHPQV